MARRNQNGGSTPHTSRNARWTPDEEEVILDEIGKSPTNVKVALLAAAERLPIRTYTGCASHWYGKMANRDDVVGKLTIGRTVAVRNKTRLKPEQMESHKKEHKRSAWRFILDLLFGNAQVTR